MPPVNKRLLHNRHLADRRDAAGTTFEAGQQKGLDRVRFFGLDDVIDDVLGKCAIYGQQFHAIRIRIIKGLRAALILGAEVSGMSLGDMEQHGSSPFLFIVYIYPRGQISDVAALKN